jgi:hypothetical protein
MRWADPLEGDSLLVVHHMHMIVLANLRLYGPAVMFEYAVDVIRDFDIAVLLAHKLLNPRA